MGKREIFFVSGGRWWGLDPEGGGEGSASSLSASTGKAAEKSILGSTHSELGSVGSRTPFLQLLKKTFLKGASKSQPRDL